AGGVRRAGGRGPALADEPRRDAAARAGRRDRARERRTARAALAMARVASRPRDAQEGGGRRQEAGAGGSRRGGTNDRSGKEAGGGLRPRGPRGASAGEDARGGGRGCRRPEPEELPASA